MEARITTARRSARGVILRSGTSGGVALVAPIEAAAFRDLDHRALLAALDRARLRAVQGEGLMTAPAPYDAKSGRAPSGNSPKALTGVRQICGYPG